ncbi:MAG: hypothetical protein IM600_01755 [Bacteroidetes bacterium]|nr:hypothetical protein [Bacteroidota bacterium]MCA6442130.1 hypothetical protein [Bacteroidota bacterium]
MPEKVLNLLKEKLILYRGENYKAESDLKAANNISHLLESLEYYLITGVYKWNNSKTDFSIETVLLETIQKEPTSLIKLLKKIGKKEKVRKRIVYQFYEENIIKIIKLVEPVNGKIIIKYIHELDIANKNNNLIKVESSEFKKAKFLFVLTYLFVEKGSVFNTRSFVRSLIKQMAAHYNVSYNVLLIMLSKQIREEFSVLSKIGLPLYIREIFMEDVKNDTDEISSKNQEEKNIQTGLIKDTSEILFVFLETSIVPINVNKLTKQNLYSLFLHLLESNPNKVKNFLARNRDQVILKNITHYFPDKIIEQIIKLFQPNNAGWLISIVFIIKNSELDFEILTTHGKYRETLNQILLEKSIDLENSSFNKGNIIKDVISFLADNLKMDELKLAQNIKKGFEKTDNSAYGKLIDIELYLEKSYVENNVSENFLGIVDENRIEEIVKSIQPNNANWIMALSSAIIKSRQYFNFLEASNLNEFKVELYSEIIINSTKSKNTVFSKEAYLRNLLVTLSIKSKIPTQFFLINAKTALEKVGYLEYSNLINVDYKDIERQVEKISSKGSMNKTLLENTILRIQPQYSKWIFDLFNVLTKAQNHFNFINTDNLSSFKSELYSDILNITLKYKSNIFNKEVFIKLLLGRLSKKSKMDVDYFLKESKIAIQKTGFIEYSGLINLEAKEQNIEKVENKDKYFYNDGNEIEKLDSNKQIDVLIYFLTNGKLPWWSEVKDEKEAFMILGTHYTKKRNKRLQNFLKRNISESKIRKHLITIILNSFLSNEINFFQHEKENVFLKKLLPEIQHKFNYPEYLQIFLETYLVFSFLKKEKGENTLWEEIQKVVKTFDVDIISFYKELLRIDVFSKEKYFNEYFLLFNSKLIEKLAYNKRINEDDIIQLENEKVDRNTLLTSDESVMEVNFEKSKINPYYLQNLEYLINCLQTGRVSKGLKVNEKDLVLSVLDNFKSNGSHSENKYLYIILKNEMAFNRFIFWFNEPEVINIINILFKDEFIFIEKYLHDFKILFKQGNSKSKMNIDFFELLKISFLFLIANKSKTFSISDYIKYIISKTIRDSKEYYDFLSLTKIAVLKNELKLKTPLGLMLHTIGREQKRKDEKKEKIHEEVKQDFVFIENAGLILLWPFFSFYFQSLGLVNENKFISKSAKVRGSNLLQFLVTGKENNYEYQMPLNKLLCDLPKNFPIDTSISLTDEERKMSEELLNTAISRWDIISNTSIEGLRNSFLKRDGKIEWGEDKIILHVEMKSYDMLVDKIPWNISVIKLPWMKNSLYVKWR